MKIQHYEEDRKFLTKLLFKLGAFIVVLCLAFGLFVKAVDAQSRPIPCSPRVDIIKHLEKKYQEAPVGAGIANVGGLVELIMSEDGSTWTILVSLPDGTSCFVSAGTNWRFKKFSIKEKGENT